jgi:hypothetical protein
MAHLLLRRPYIYAVPERWAYADAEDEKELRVIGLGTFGPSRPWYCQWWACGEPMVAERRCLAFIENEAVEMKQVLAFANLA